MDLVGRVLKEIEVTSNFESDGEPTTTYRASAAAEASPFA